MSAVGVFLLENFLWEWSQHRQARRHTREYKPFPLPDEDARLYNASDVSIIVPTVGWGESFPKALISWLVNKPRRIIVVTTDSEKKRTEDLLASAPIQEANNGTDVKLLTVRRPDKRVQLVAGIKASAGPIFALVDDDAVWSPRTLLHLLAPFQEPDIGLVGGPVEYHVPEERRDPAVITVWEVAALRARSKHYDDNKAFYAADGSANFAVSGATMLIRSAIATDPDFQRGLRDEIFLGLRLDSGHEAFITRWVLFQHLRNGQGRLKKWRLGMQITPEARVLTPLMPGHRVAGQMEVWLMTDLRFRLTCLFSAPGFLRLRRASPYMCRKMVERFYNPFLYLLWYAAFLKVLRLWPLLAWLVAVVYFYCFVRRMVVFAREFPFCREMIWVVALVDFGLVFLDWYFLLGIAVGTLGLRWGGIWDVGMIKGLRIWRS